ncbi:Hsp33 family molecular chaperone HslO [Biformimicrobium ophioploci]|uniref:33 kDa chaperonin n=1 Tax=Biformimicrobium ophioploci TaxID=3036711 RepID=A0ABQ6M0C9_9GAMM|nr:Hsp33 family molecular chaperone HslO [Microbulbifer sp. NKW57]GMG87766.1 Hsp33 family molecular chaperone HslO [Microbulbifer sp. NKW57]
MSDQLQRFIFSGHDIRGQVVTLGDAYRDILSNNSLPAPAAHLLGEFLAAACLLSTTLKFEGILTLQARGDGNMPLIMAECTHHSDLRGIARLEADAVIPEGAGLRELLGENAVLSITIDPAKGSRYQGMVPMEADTLAGCLEHYFERSEQLATRFWLEAAADTVGGIMLQIMPGNNAATAEENAQAWDDAVAMAATVTAEELHNLPHDQLVYRLFHELAPADMGMSDIRFRCSCSRERSEQALVAMGEEEVRELLQESAGEIAADCQFCNQQYRFDSNDIDALFGSPTQTLH